MQIAMVAEGFLPTEIWGENPIRVNLQARAYGQSKLCVLALHDNESDTIKADGSAMLTAPECAVQSNSSDPDGLNVSNDSRIVSTIICSSGGVKGGVIVANQLEVKGANLVVNADYGGTDVPVPDGVGPNSSMVALSE